MKLVLKNIFFTVIFKYFTTFHYIQAIFSHCDTKQDFWIIPWIQNEIFCLKAIFVACSLFSYECTDSEFGNTYEQATRTALILIISIRKQGLEQRKVFHDVQFPKITCF